MLSNEEMMRFQEETRTGNEQGQAETGKDGSNKSNRTFTQSELDAIVKERVEREKYKYSHLAEREQNILKREQFYNAREIVRQRRLPEELLDVIDYSDEKKFNAGLDTIETLINQIVQGEVDRRIGGRDIPRSGVSDISHTDANIRRAMKLPE